MTQIPLVELLHKQYHPDPTPAPPVLVQSLPEPLPQVPEIVYTDDQLLALDAICKSIKKRGIFMLAGYAGTGKSFLCKEISRRYSRSLFTAPTNKAAKILTNDMGVPACTIHSALGLALQKGKLVQKRRPEFHNYELVVVDEASMVNQEIYTHIMEKIAPHCAILFIGDPFQLPPVKEVISPTFDTPNYAELNEIVRQGKDNPIIAYSMTLRDKGFSKFGIPYDGKSILRANPTTYEEWLQLLINNYMDGGVYAAWTNETVNNANLGVHRAIYGETAPDYAVGEKLVLNAPWVNDNMAVLGHVGDEFTVKSVCPTKAHGMNAWLIDVGMYDEQSPEDNRLLVVAETSKEKYKNDLQQLANIKNWAEYYELKERFHDVSHTYAFTCHKLQGSSYNNVMVDVDDILKNRNTGEMNRCMYVAITRTRNKVTFL